MRVLLLLVVLALVASLVPLGAAQAPTGQPCSGGRGFGGSRPDGAPPGGAFPNGTRPPRNGTAQGGGPGNGTGNRTGGFRGEPIENLTASLDPVTGELGPGESATATLTLRNDGPDALDLELSAPSFGRANATPTVNATIEPATLRLDAGASTTASVAVRVASDAPTGCEQTVFVLIRETGTNRTANARLVVTIPAPPTDGAPSAAVTAQNQGASQAPAKSPATPLGAALLALGALSLALRRR